MLTPMRYRRENTDLIPAWGLDEAEMTCINCAHRDLLHETILPVPRSGRISLEKCAPCRVNAVEPDAGGCVPMLAEDGHCRFHAAAFRPSEACLGMLRNAEEARRVA